MSDPNYMHEFWPNRKGTCQSLVSGKHCGLPGDAPVHRRWKQKYALELSNEAIDITAIVTRMTSRESESEFGVNIVPETEIYSIEDVAVNFQLNDDGHVIMRLVHRRN